MMTGITVIILTYNEGVHIRRAIESVRSIADEIIVVDSFSTDETCSIAEAAGARVVQHAFTNQAAQINWATENLQINTPWIFRLDADEYITVELQKEILEGIHSVPQEVNGIVLNRRMIFIGRWLRYGGMYPVQVLRIWRHGYAYTESRWMDEHVVIKSGRTVRFKYDFVDENLRSLTWWTEKHNQYATREAIEILNGQFHFIEKEQDQQFTSGYGTNQRRWMKKNMFMKVPALIRPVVFFCYRYIVRGGFLDGKAGFVWHTLQGFWYRYLIDAKVYQIRKWAREENLSIPETLRKYHPELYKQLFSSSI